MVISSLEENAKVPPKVSILGVTSYFKSLVKLKLCLALLGEKPRAGLFETGLR